jgi:hypothetical protein
MNNVTKAHQICKNFFSFWGLNVVEFKLCALNYSINESKFRYSREQALLLPGFA